MKAITIAGVCFAYVRCCEATTVETIQSNLCESTYGTDATETTCPLQKGRIACYARSHCNGGVSYSGSLQDWLSKCPGSLVAEYNKNCGRHLLAGGGEWGLLLLASVCIGIAVVFFWGGFLCVWCLCQRHISPVKYTQGGVIHPQQQMPSPLYTTAPVMHRSW